VLLAFPPEAEMVDNTRVLTRYALNRPDLDVRSALATDTMAQVEASQAAGRPVFLGFVYDFGQNAVAGVRGVAHKTRAETLTLVASHGIANISPEQAGTLGPWKVTVSPILLKWPPLLQFRFGYGWELDRCC
jgi:hypothetical protein